MTSELINHLPSKDRGQEIDKKPSSHLISSQRLISPNFLLIDSVFSERIPDVV